ncbi:MFS transporter [Paenibacillus sp. R14(2021)]|uniref:MFS transporter n=1 Tax=Paenibacillus sp. R14(2021) TaxID=2859228 RepID=UPI001C61644F|nr:MFS transporter [Paenibacillus sp. R14(2021)]
MNNVLVFKQEKQYRRLFWAGLINGIGDRFSQVAVLSLLLSLTGSGVAIGITFAVRLVPYFIFGPLGGMLADRFSKKSIMILADLLRILFALLPLLVREASDVWIIYASSFLLSAGEAFYAPARMSAIPQIVQKGSLLHVNGLEEAMLGIVLIGGSLTGSMVASTVGVHATFVMNAVSFLLSAILLARITIPRQSMADNLKQSPSTSPWKGMREFRKLMSGSAFIRAMIIVFVLWPIGDGIFNILISVYAVEVFKMGDIGIGILYGALGLGLVLGSGIIGKFSTSMKVTAISALLLEGILNIIISQSSYFIMVVLFLTLTASCAAIGNACNRTILMNEIPSHFQGQFFGMLATLQNTILGISMFVSGFLLEVITPRTLGFSGGILFSFVGVGFAFVCYKTLQNKGAQHL